MNSYLISDLSQISDCAQWVLEKMEDRKVLLLKGPMGAGKTTLAKAMCQVLSCSDIVSSPTFSIIQEYLCPKGKVFHMDLYRLNDIEEAFDAGVEEALFSGEMCIVEWPEKILPLLPDAYTILNFGINNNLRHLHLENYG
jgi:tRNA threonylcarbamoyladenosine biosynthesis protein TsaE